MPTDLTSAELPGAPERISGHDPQAGDPVAIEIRDVSKTFRIPTDRIDTFKERAVHPFRPNNYRTLKALESISLDIRKGEFFGIVGRNGSGKSTLLQSLMGYLKPARGRVEVVGHDTRRTPISQLARHVGYLFQNPDHQLFGDTIWDEAILAPRNFGLLDQGRRAEIECWIERVGLKGREADPPFRLSYGQKRRLNLISVLGHAPRLLLLDEVLIGQDPDNAAFVLTLLREAADRGVGVLLVSHAPEVAATYADRVLFLSEGRVVVDAGPDEAGRTSTAPELRPRSVRRGGDALAVPAHCARRRCLARGRGRGQDRQPRGRVRRSASRR